ncbi:YgaP family membrane protein [Polycladidibacter stylochi]|uniref:YgaP family membrane protein n=1 Tax=Polycladidibacter stylochi TaxID=1807766 RepID=UPI000834C050|nr:DUF2892 domain-containing protein [Pseudovibrio stylochi]
MTSNVGNIDRVLRLILGLVLIIMPFTTSMSIWQSTTYTYLSVAIGVVLVATAAMRFCLLYRILGIGAR